jgi:mono/diheme cytochrome c family protein
MREATRRKTTVALMGALLLLIPATGALAQDDADGAARLGQIAFREYCRSCHGNLAKGDGPVAEHLKPKPADLTGIAERNGGEFPAEKVHAAIAGGKDVAGHGNSEMPVWGNAFKKVRGGQSEAEVDEKISNLVAYLASIQR